MSSYVGPGRRCSCKSICGISWNHGIFRVYPGFFRVLERPSLAGKRTFQSQTGLEPTNKDFEVKWQVVVMDLRVVSGQCAAQRCGSLFSCSTSGRKVSTSLLHSHSCWQDDWKGMSVVRTDVRSKHRWVRHTNPSETCHPKAHAAVLYSSIRYKFSTSYFFDDWGRKLQHLVCRVLGTCAGFHQARLAATEVRTRLAELEAQVRYAWFCQESVVSAAEKWTS